MRAFLREVRPIHVVKLSLLLGVSVWGIASLWTPPDVVDRPQSRRVVAKSVSALEPYPETEATSPPGPAPKSVYCVRKSGSKAAPGHTVFPSDDYDESDYPECVWVDHLEDVPEGEDCLPSGCNSSDHEYTRRYWCTEGMAEEPPLDQIPPECRTYFR